VEAANTALRYVAESLYFVWRPLYLLLLPLADSLGASVRVRVRVRVGVRVGVRVRVRVRVSPLG